MNVKTAVRLIVIIAVASAVLGCSIVDSSDGAFTVTIRAKIDIVDGRTVVLIEVDENLVSVRKLVTDP